MKKRNNTISVEKLKMTSFQRYERCLDVIKNSRNRVANIRFIYKLLGLLL